MQMEKLVTIQTFKTQFGAQAPGNIITCPDKHHPSPKKKECNELCKQFACGLETQLETIT